MKRFLAIAAAVATLLGLQASGVYATVLIDMIDAENVASLDWLPGNALAVGAIPAAETREEYSFDIFYQGALGGYLNANGREISGTGLNTAYEVTLVAGFGENAQLNTCGKRTTVDFSLDPNAEHNYFRIYYDESLDSNALAGTGYDNGTLIMEGYGTSVDGNFAIFNESLAAMDSFLEDDYEIDGQTIGTWASAGGVTILEGVVAFVDPDFFLSPANLFISELFFNTSQVVPFREVDPSREFNVGIGMPIIPDYGPGVGRFYATNGLLPNDDGSPSDFQIQADANNCFAVIPEPSTILLFGVGLVGIAGIGRKKLKK